jgi:hypothetical protein
MAGVLIAGFLRAQPSERVLGIFGMITAAQTLTGLLEFSRYQRAGWLLMIAAACAAGWIGAWIARLLRPERLRLIVLGVGALACAGWGLVCAPGHASAVSSAEELMIHVTRFLGRLEPVSLEEPVYRALSYPRPAALEEALTPDLPVTLVVRSTSGRAARGFWELTDAVVPYSSALPIVNVRSAESLEGLPAVDRQTIVFLDRAQRLASDELGSVAALDPEQPKRYADWQYRHYRANETIRAFVNGVDTGIWRRHDIPLSTNAEVVVFVPSG